MLAQGFALCEIIIFGLCPKDIAHEVVSRASGQLTAENCCEPDSLIIQNGNYFFIYKLDVRFLSQQK